MSERVVTVFRTIPMITVMGIIFALSHQSGDQLDLPEIPLLDKIGHFVLYGLLAATILFVPSCELRLSRPKTIAVVAVLLSFLYGIGDEFHQSFVPGRYVSLADIAADIGGSAVVSLLWLRYRSLKDRRGSF